MALYDIHCHLLPHIDDGKAEADQLAGILEVYKESGFDGIVFTPHLFNPYLTTNVKGIRPAWEAARKLAADVGIKVLLGSELFCSTQAVYQGIPFGGKYQLIEFQTILPVAGWLDKVRVLAKTITPVIAHVERYQWMTPDSPDFRALKEMGCRIQVNVDGIANGKALPYLERDLVDVIADDNHWRKGGELLPVKLMEDIAAWPKVAARMDAML